MIIVAGWLRVAPEDRAQYLDGVAGVAVSARAATGCLDFVQSADPIDAGRINIFERWADDDSLTAFRSGGPEEADPELPEILDADVAKYRIASVEAP